MSMDTLEEQLERLKRKAEPAVRSAGKPKRAEGEGGRAGDRAPGERARGRKVHIGAWLHRDFKRSIKIVQAQTDEDVQTILARLLNAEFHKRKIPVVETT